MRPDPGPIPLEDLRAHGVLLEINRRVLHPVGLSLSVESPGGTLRLTRDEASGRGGVIFGGMPGLAAKAEAFRALEAAEHPGRFGETGFIIEPLPGDPPRTIRALSADTEALWPEVERMAQDLVRDLPLTTDLLETVAAVVSGALPRAVVAPLLGRLALVSTDGGASWQYRLDDPPQAIEDGPTIARCAFILAEIDRLQSGGESPVTQAESETGQRASAEIREYVVAAKGELYDSELEDLAAARARFEVLCGRTVHEDTAPMFEGDLADVHRMLERLYGNAQPGMRVYRGDDAAREAFNGHRVALREAAHSAVERMSQRERLDAGELHDFEDADWPGLENQLTAEHADAVEACAELERQLNAAIQAREAAQRGMAVCSRALARRVA